MENWVLVEETAGGTSAVLRAAGYGAAGVPVACVLPVHDRNRVAVEGDLAALADVGVRAVVVDTVPPAGRVRDLTPREAVGLARRAGLRVAVRGPVEDAGGWRATGAELVLEGGRWRAL